MNVKQANEIVKTPADGIVPITGKGWTGPNIFKIHSALRVSSFLRGEKIDALRHPRVLLHWPGTGDPLQIRSPHPKS